MLHSWKMDDFINVKDEPFMHSAEVWDAVERKVISTESDNTGNKCDKDR